MRHGDGLTSLAFGPGCRDGTAPLTRQDILARWPEPAPPPRPDSLWRTPTRGCELGVLVRTGAGTKGEAFRYGLAQHEPVG